MSRHIVVLGGGVSGLCTAYFIMCVCLHTRGGCVGAPQHGVQAARRSGGGCRAGGHAFGGFAPRRRARALRRRGRVPVRARQSEPAVCLRERDARCDAGGRVVVPNVTSRTSSRRARTLNMRALTLIEDLGLRVRGGVRVCTVRACVRVCACVRAYVNVCVPVSASVSASVSLFMSVSVSVSAVCVCVSVSVYGMGVRLVSCLVRWCVPLSRVAVTCGGAQRGRAAHWSRPLTPSGGSSYPAGACGCAPPSPLLCSSPTLVQDHRAYAVRAAAGGVLRDLLLARPRLGGGDESVYDFAVRRFRCVRAFVEATTGAGGVHAHGLPVGARGRGCGQVHALMGGGGAASRLRTRSLTPQ